MSYYNKCVYHKCNNKSNEISMFRFPIKDKPCLEEWIKNSGNIYLHALSNDELKSQHICAAHFPPASIHKGCMRSRLFRGAVPTHFHSEVVSKKSKNTTSNINVDKGAKLMEGGAELLNANLVDFKVLKPARVYGNPRSNVPKDPLDIANEAVNSSKRKLQENETNKDMPECKRLAEIEYIELPSTESREPISEVLTLHQCDHCLFYFISLEDLRDHAISENHETSQYPEISQNSPESIEDEQEDADHTTLNDITPQNSPESIEDEQVDADHTTLNEILNLEIKETSHLEITSNTDPKQSTMNKHVVADSNTTLSPKTSHISVPKKSYNSLTMSTNLQLNSEETGCQPNSVTLSFYEVSSYEDDISEPCDPDKELSNPEKEQCDPEKEQYNPEKTQDNLERKNNPETQKTDTDNFENEISYRKNAAIKNEDNTSENKIDSPSNLLDNGISGSEVMYELYFSDSELSSNQRELFSPIEPISHRLQFKDELDDDLCDEVEILDYKAWKFGKSYKNKKLIDNTANNSRIIVKDEPLKEMIDSNDGDDYT